MQIGQRNPSGPVGWALSCVLVCVLVCLRTEARPRPAPGTQAPAGEVSARLLEVLDGDTLRVEIEGTPELVRLLGVDAEETFHRPFLPPAAKPATAFGVETTLRLRARLDPWVGKESLRLVFPGEGAAGEEVRQRDAFGRLLAHVRLPGREILSHWLIRNGYSPYYVKYGRCRLFDRELEVAQRRARAERKGIWNPATNVPGDDTAPRVVVPYEKLLPWWSARAAAIDRFRALRERAPERTFDARSAEHVVQAMARAELRSQELFTFLVEVERTFGERDGALTVLARCDDRRTALRVRVAPGHREAVQATIDLTAAARPFQQNFVLVTGRLTPGPRGPLLGADDQAQWERAGPEPER